MPELVREVREKLASIKKSVKVAVMGCEVNGPGEAAEADIGLAGCGSGVMLFTNGKSLGTFERGEALQKLLEIIERP